MLPSRLILIADEFTDEVRAEQALAAVRAGVRWIHLRDHRAAPKRFEESARSLVTQLQTADHQVAISVNAQVEVAEALRVHFHGGRRGPDMAEVRQRLGEEAVIGFSAHKAIEAESERAQDVDYFFFSPVFPTPTKPDHPGAGIRALRSFCETARPVPVFALGGITPERIADCRAVGAYGVAVLSGIMDAEAPEAAARAYLRALAAPA